MTKLANGTTLPKFSLLPVFAFGLMACASQNCNVALATDHASQSIGPKWAVDAVDGNQCGWKPNAKAHVICFLGCECPVARFYATRLASLQQEYGSQGVEFIAVMSNRHDSQQDILRFARELSVPFPLVLDSKQSIAKELHATRTAEVVVLDREASVRYRGRVDDQMSPGIKRSEAKHEELRKILSEIVTGQDISIANTDPVGCLISFEKIEAKSANVSYCKDIAPIFYKHCYECHRTGDIGPFDISEFEEVRGWADMIGEVLSNGRMPPWHASDGHAKLRNQRGMHPSEMKIVQAWIDAGAPYGNESDLPSKPQLGRGWLMTKEPDLVVHMRNKPFTVPASGEVEYQYFVVDPKLEEDKWVNASQVIPGNSSIVHHAIVFIRPPDGERFQGVSWLTAFVPGQRPASFAPGYARRIPAGSKFVFQMHYTPNGVEQTDLTKLGLTYVDPSEVTHEVSTIMGIDQSFEIPPHASNHVVHRHVPLPTKDSTLMAVSPHMHLRGKSFQLRSRATDGSTAVLVDVPRYDFNWQHTYEFESPLPLSTVSELDFDVAFDNSKENPFNPNPDEHVMWGDQTWEEMAVAFLEIATPIGASEKSSVGMRRKAKTNTRENQSDIAADSREWAEKYIQRFDANRDGRVAFSESNDLIQRYSFRLIDQDKDSFLTLEELANSFEERRGR